MVRSRTGRRQAPPRSALNARPAAAEDGDVVRDPAITGRAGAAASASRERRGPERDAIELVVARTLAALLAQQGVALAGGQYYRNRAEPGREVTLQLGVDRMLHPHVGAVRMLGIDMHHRGVGPA